MADSGRLSIKWRVPQEPRKPAQLKQFGVNLRRVRDQKNFTQEQLAEKSDLHPRALQKIEAGAVDASVTTLLRLQKALKCSWEDLLGKP